jgi:glucose-1-phosphate adenylyltransferase
MTEETESMEGKVLAMVLAGGEGSRLHPLTAERSKPAVPFGGHYRIVDFVLSNLVNSQVFSIYLLVQYKSQSLIEHIRRSWTLSPIFPEQFVTVVPPQMRERPDWFQGTADAVYQNLTLIEQQRPDLVLVFGADHIYRMDVRQMVAFHRAQGADVTVAALPVPRASASAFGVIELDAQGRIRRFLEKPEQPPAMPGDPARAYASMGNYAFSTDVLIDALKEANTRGEHDFGRHVLPRMIGTHRVFAYDFGANRVPGVRDYEEQAYWRDVGTIDTYFETHQDLLGWEPRFNLFNPQWRIASSNYQGPSARILRGTVENSILGSGALLKGGFVKDSILRREVIVEDGAEIDQCIVMDYAIIRHGARLKRVIIDRYNTIAPESRIGYDPGKDRAAGYHVTESGIVVISKGDHTVFSATGEFSRYL